MTKYRAKPTVVDGIRFHSQKEAKRYQGLKLLVRAGEISALLIQPKFPVVYGKEHLFTYQADFSYWEGNRRVVEDVKGIKTPIYKLKKKIVEAVYGIKILET